jgi:hypothetical protein
VLEVVMRHGVAARDTARVSGSSVIFMFKKEHPMARQ